MQLEEKGFVEEEKAKAIERANNKLAAEITADFERRREENYAKGER